MSKAFPWLSLVICIGLSNVPGKDADTLGVEGAWKDEVTDTSERRYGVAALFFYFLNKAFINYWF